MDQSSKKYTFPIDPVIPDLGEWPLVRLSNDREHFLEDLIGQTKSQLIEKLDNPELLFNELGSVLYQEKIRLTQTPWAADPQDEKDFWSGIKYRLLQAHSENKSQAEFDEGKQILEDTLKRYGNEIAGNFDPGTYNFAKRAVPALMGMLLKASRSGRGGTVYDRIRVTGDIELIRELSTKGTLIMLPTHFSNLDSMVIGWVIQFLGLPAFIYGAGLNLFGIKLISYFISRLGAYRVDRRKKNKIYLEILKNYSSLAIQRGAHSLFFPGGTRSRSGMIEKQLKLGLMGTAIEAQRKNFMNFPAETAKKVFILPVNINYHFVLEAEALINQHLKREGKDRFLVENDRFSTSYRIAQFILKFISAGSDMTMSFGPVTDIFGNTVDAAGTSYDYSGRPVDVKRYFMSGGKISEDKQRDSEYTRMLGEHVVKTFHTHNTVLSSHLVAYTAFQIIYRRHEKLDLFGVLRLPADDLRIENAEFLRNIDQLKNRLKEIHGMGKVLLSPEVQQSPEEIIEHGMKHLGLFHPKRVLFKEGNHFSTDDAKLLYYYHNRLVGYDLDKFISLDG